MILLVEDSEEDYAAYRRAFAAARFTVPLRRVSSGEEALDYLAQSEGVTDLPDLGRPCLILLDLNLPGTSGLEVIRHIRATETLKKLPVIVVTTSSATRDKAQCEQLGVEGYLTKAMDFHQFRDDIHALLRHWSGTIYATQDLR